MKTITQQDLVAFIEKNIPDFHARRIASLQDLKLANVLRRKNPYLFKAKHITMADEFVRRVLDAHLSSQEETVFGDFLEQLAIFVCSHVFGGRKSSAEGVDLEFARDGNYYIVSIKSGPNWGNSSQIRKMKDAFVRAKRVLGTNQKKTNVVAVNGCCYGRDNVEDKGEYLKLCGQKFWAFVSGIDSLYLDIIEPLGHKARERNDVFYKEYGKTVNLFTKQFIKDFCFSDGAIDWQKIVILNSGAK
jgi:hypothetical protein